jgi:hypothetical protein
MVGSKVVCRTAGGLTSRLFLGEEEASFER